MTNAFHYKAAKRRVNLVLTPNSMKAAFTAALIFSTNLLQVLGSVGRGLGLQHAVHARQKQVARSLGADHFDSVFLNVLLLQKFKNCGHGFPLSQPVWRRVVFDSNFTKIKLDCVLGFVFALQFHSNFIEFMPPVSLQTKGGNRFFRAVVQSYFQGVASCQ